MKKEKQRKLCGAICMLFVFLLWTLAVRFIDTGAIGPRESSVGFAAINQFAHDLTGVHMSLYMITDWLGLVPLMFALGFAALGLAQWIQRKHILKVDHSILMLGGFYMVVMAVYLIFETVVVNYRPVLINGCLEPSYPSSTTMLVMCIMPTAVMQLNVRIKNNALKRCISSAIIAFIAFMVIGRFISGVHWLTDIVGGALFSAGLVWLYYALTSQELR